MLKPESQRRSLWLAATAAGLLAGLALLALGAAALSNYQAADYPGALLVANHNLYRATPTLFFRRDTTYRTTDPFPQVYNWYSQTFNLGPEVRAQSACIVMEKSTTWWVVEGTVGVMLCDTPSGRMMFVQRSLLLRYRPR